VAGLHAAAGQAGKQLRQARVLIACAGMEGPAHNVTAGLACRASDAACCGFRWATGWPPAMAALNAFRVSALRSELVVNIDNGLYGAWRPSASQRCCCQLRIGSGKKILRY